MRDTHFCVVVVDLAGMTSYVASHMTSHDVIRKDENKIIHNLAPPPLVECLSCPSSGRAGRTRASIRGDWVPQFRRTAFGQSAFSIKVIGRWNSIPTHIRDSGSLVEFKSSLKLWLKETQKCNHLWLTGLYSDHIDGILCIVSFLCIVFSVLMVVVSSVCLSRDNRCKLAVS